jgi:hypothetical protein
LIAAFVKDETDDDPYDDANFWTCAAMALQSSITWIFSDGMYSTNNITIVTSELAILAAKWFHIRTVGREGDNAKRYRRKINLLCFFLGAFFLGGVGGHFLWYHIGGSYALYAISGAVFICAIVYAALFQARHAHEAINDEEEDEETELGSEDPSESEIEVYQDSFKKSEWRKAQLGAFIMFGVMGFLTLLMALKFDDAGENAVGVGDYTDDMAKTLAGYFAGKSPEEAGIENKDKVFGQTCIGLIIFTIFFGSCFVGTLFIGFREALTHTYRYGVLLIVEALLFLSAGFFNKDRDPSHEYHPVYLCCAAAGLQSAITWIYGNGLYNSCQVTDVTNELFIQVI